MFAEEKEMIYANENLEKMNENIEIIDFPEWKPVFGCKDILNNPPVSTRQKILAIKNYYKNFENQNVNVEISTGNIAKIIENAKEPYYIAFRTFRQTNNSDVPFFSIGKERKAELAEMGIGKVLLVYWEKQNSGAVAQTFFCMEALKNIEENWNNEKGILYRVNFSKDDADATENYISNIKSKIKLVASNKGTKMANSTED